MYKLNFELVSIYLVEIRTFSSYASIAEQKNKILGRRTHTLWYLVCRILIFNFPHHSCICFSDHWRLASWRV